MKRITMILGPIIFLAYTQVHATITAIIDSGVDTQHFQLRDRVSINQVDSTFNNLDEDKNGFIDDVFGWNFAENNNQVIDYKYQGTFSKDVYLFFEVQGKLLDGNASSEEIAWMNSKKKDEDFLQELMKFGNYVHGTHVAGISTQQGDHSKVFTVKLIPTEVKMPGGKSFNREMRKKIAKTPFDLRLMLAKGMLQKLAEQQMATLIEIAKYVHSHSAKVANGSFGTGYAQALMVAKIIYKGMFNVDPSDEDSKVLATHLLNTLLAKGKSMAASAPETLFVFAAGNSGTNNDEVPMSPANVKAPNVMSVAATYRNIELAPFSCYGKNSVDVAAPGVNILSSIPGDEEIKMSGTSQAAPFVSGVASEIYRINPNLHPAQIKKILMQTVDKKDWLAKSVKSGGVVNSQRAYFAAKSSLKVSLAKAIGLAQTNVEDMPSEDENFDRKNRNDNINRKWALPLPSPIMPVLNNE